jgi:hypothetical protein
MSQEITNFRTYLYEPPLEPEGQSGDENLTAACKKVGRIWLECAEKDPHLSAILTAISKLSKSDFIDHGAWEDELFKLAYQFQDIMQKSHHEQNKAVKDLGGITAAMASWSIQAAAKAFSITK